MTDHHRSTTVITPAKPITTPAYYSIINIIIITILTTTSLSSHISQSCSHQPQTNPFFHPLLQSGGGEKVPGVFF